MNPDDFAVRAKDPAQDLEEAQRWTNLTQELIAMAPEFNRDRLKAAVDSLARRCNDCWEDVQSGDEAAEFGAADLCIDLTAITEDMAVAFAGQTALLIFGGMDGPFATAEALKDGIDTLADELEKT